MNLVFFFIDKNNILDDKWYCFSNLVVNYNELEGLLGEVLDESGIILKNSLAKVGWVMTPLIHVIYSLKTKTRFICNPENANLQSSECCVNITTLKDKSSVVRKYETSSLRIFF